MARTILIVDDSETERLLITRILSEEYIILSAEGGEEALDILKRNFKTITAVILDIMMPGMDGFEVLKNIRSNYSYKSIPVIVTTSLDDEKTFEKAINLGANGFVAKPFSKALLKHTLKNAVELRESSAIANTLWRDKLTGLLNRGAFFSDAARALSRHEAGFYILASLNVDSFKIINDQYGTDKGDELLKFIADCLSRYFSAHEGLVCHLTADKFAVLYPAKYYMSQSLADLHIEISYPKCINRRIMIRVGRYLASDLSLTVSAMYDRAALAEESIKGRYDTYFAVYNDNMRRNMIEEQSIVNRMEAALENKEFVIWYQPQYNHATGAMIGAEALVRWKRDGVFVSPAEFIPVFERNGFIYELDQYVWRSVCKRLRFLLDAGKKPLPVSVNISRRDLQHNHFIAVLMSIVKEYSIPLDLMRLEVTESALGDQSVIIKVNDLINLGFTVEIDDFGSGYSSLNTLKDVPASILKLDMKFFESSGNTQRGGNIVESVVRMAKWLGMAVIAEGVEDKEQADFLKTIGCYYIQGYYYARPMPTEDYEALEEKAQKEPSLIHLITLDTLDNNEFWNPHSMETLIFNSYVGGACIFEYAGGKTELLRSNERYVKELGSLYNGAEMTGNASIARFLGESGVSQLGQAIQKAIDTRAEASCEVTLSDSYNTEYLRITVRLIASAGERRLFYCVIVNMTEQREAERRQLESAHMLEVIMGNINGGVSAIMINDDGTSQFVFNNAKYYELYGYTREQAEAEKLDVMSLIFPEDLPLVMKKVNKLKKDGKPVIIDYRITKRDGKAANLRANASLMNMEGYGEVISSVVTDMTEKISLEEQLRAIVDNINGGVTATIMHEGAAQFVIVNDRFFKMLGYNSKKEYEAACPDKYTDVHPDDVERVKKQFESFDGGKKHFSMNYRIVRPDGEIRYIINNISIVNLFGIDAPVSLSVCNDITEQRMAQLAADEAHDKLKTVLNNAGNGITAIALRGDKPEIIFANDKYFEIIGYTREQYREATKDDMFAHIAPEDREMMAIAIKKVNKNHGGICVEYRVITHDNRTVWVRSTVNITDMVGYDVPVQVAVFSDITAQKQATERLRELNEALEGSRAQIESLPIQLLDNLPCGAALYEYSNGQLSVVHINKRYWELVERHSTAYAKNAVFNAVHPDDIEAMRLEINEAVAQHRELSCDARIRCGKSGYKPFHITAAHIEKQRGVYLFYATYSQIPEGQMSLQEMLPVALSTVMSASGDFSYVKDRDGRYLCCSESTARLVGEKDSRSFFGKTDSELFDKSIADLFIGEDNEIFSTGKPILDRIERVSFNSEHTLLVNNSKYPILDAEGNTVGIYGVSRDVTQEKKTDFELKMLLRAIPSGVLKYSADEHERIEYINASFIKGLGYGKKQFVEKFKNCFGELVYKDDRKRVKHEILTQEVDGRIGKFDFRVEAADGTLRWFHDEGTCVTDETGKDWYYVTLVDITEQKKTEQSLRTAKEEFRIAALHSGITTCRFDVAGKTLTITADAAKRFKLPEQLKGIPQSNVKNGRISQKTADSYISFFEKIRHGAREATAVVEMLLPSGWRWLEMRATTIFDDDGNSVSAVVTYIDVTERLRTFEQAQSDALTGLYNRVAFCEKMEKLTASRQKDSFGALMLMDIDGFKNINDSYGHAKGDSVLIGVGKTVLKLVGGDDLVCRMGGDEFLVYLADEKSIDSVRNMAEKLCENITMAFSDINITASIGIALCPQDGTAFEKLYKKADKALYSVKNNGKAGCTFYSKKMENV